MVNDIPLRDQILICGDLNVVLTADGCRGRNLCGEANSNSEALQTFINLHDLISENGIMRQKRKQVANNRRLQGKMHALRLDIRQESYQTMCTQGHEYQNNSHDFRPSVIINRLPTPLANREETYGIDNQLVVYRFAKYEN